MGKEFFRRAVFSAARIQSVGSTGTSIPGFSGTTVIGSGGSTTDKVYALARPDAIGEVRHVVFASTGAQKATLTLAGATASGFFHGSTFRSIVFTTNSTKRRNVTLVGLSTTWAITAISTGTTLAG